MSDSISSRESFFEHEIRSPVTPEDLEEFTNTDSADLAQLWSKSRFEGHDVEAQDPKDSSFRSVITDSGKQFSFLTSSTRHSVLTDSCSSTSTKESIQQKGSLFSSADFKTMVGPARWWHGATYRTVVHALRDYERDELLLPLDKKIERLQDLQTKAQAYFNKKSIQCNKDPLSRSLQERKSAGEFLLNGIKAELDTWTCEKAKETFNTTDIIDLQKNTKECSLLSGGNINECVEKITLEDGSATVFKAVSKDSQFESEPASLAGIPSTSTIHLASRSVGAYVINKLLGWGLIPKTSFATRNHQIGFCQTFVEGESLSKEEFVPIGREKMKDSSQSHYDVFKTFIKGEGLDLGGEFSISCELPLIKTEDGIYKDGQRIDLNKALELLGKNKITFSQKKITHISNIDFSNPQLQKTLSKAHLFYLIVGAVDPNLSNLIFTQEGVALIDNDFSFPEEFGNFNNPKRTPLETVRQKTGMPVDILPDLIDEDAAKEIEALNLDEVFQELKKLNLTTKEIEATRNRITLLKEHIAQARANGASGMPRLVKEWDKETFEKLTVPIESDRGGNHHYNNYLGVIVESKTQLQQKQKQQQ